MITHQDIIKNRSEKLDLEENFQLLISNINNKESKDMIFALERKIVELNNQIRSLQEKTKIIPELREENKVLKKKVNNLTTYVFKSRDYV